MPNYREDRPSAAAGGGEFDGIGPAPRRQSQQEQSGPHQRPHEELVAAFRAAIKETKDPSISPEELLHHQLVNQHHSSSLGDDKAKFFERLEETWEVLICDRLPPGSPITRKVDGGLQVSYIKYRKPGPDNAPQSILDLNDALLPIRHTQSRCPFPLRSA